MKTIHNTYLRNMLEAVFVLALLASTVNLAAQKPPQRIISLAPNITEMIFKIGAGDALVGRTDYCLYPPAAEPVTSVGALLNPNYESIVALDPDVVFMLPNPQLEQALGRFGLKTHILPNETIADILRGIQSLGDVLGLSERAKSICLGIQDTLDFVSGHTTSQDSLSAMIVIGREAGSLNGLYAAGGDTYLSEIWNLCGGKNIFSDVPIRYFDVAIEDLLVRNPDVIIEFRVMGDLVTREEIESLQSDWDELPTLKAVRQKQLYMYTDRYFLIPGPRIAKVALALHKILGGTTP